LCESDRFAEVGLGQLGPANFELQLPATRENIGPESYFLRIRVERVLNCAEGVAERAVEGQSLCQKSEIVSDSYPCPNLG
jgi:hypothetical protein